VQRLVVLVAIAEAAPALAFAAAVIVGHDVVMTIRWVVTAPDPGDGRGLGARRAGVRRASAACTQEPVDGAMPPILAALRVARIRGPPGARRGRRLAARHRQEWHRGRTEHQRADAADEAPP